MASPPAELVVLVPVLNRPQKVEPLIHLFKITTPQHRMLFIADSDDAVELEALRAADADYMTLDPPVNWAKKVNAGFRATTESFLFVAADDVEPQDGWYVKAQAAMTDGIGVVGTIDFCNRRTHKGLHATHMLIRRSYIEEFGTVDEPGKVVHEGYPHEYADDELVQTAMARGAYAHAYESVVRHMHPLGGYAEDDETYRLGCSLTHVGRALFESRQHLWASG